MKIEQRENGINLIPESKFEREILERLRKEAISRMQWEDAWECKGKLIIDFDDSWGK
jgi:hypothetical protein